MAFREDYQARGTLIRQWLLKGPIPRRIPERLHAQTGLAIGKQPTPFPTVQADLKKIQATRLSKTRSPPAQCQRRPRPHSIPSQYTLSDRDINDSDQDEPANYKDNACMFYSTRTRTYTLTPKVY